MRMHGAVRCSWEAFHWSGHLICLPLIIIGMLLRSHRVTGATSFFSIVRMKKVDAFVPDLVESRLEPRKCVKGSVCVLCNAARAEWRSACMQKEPGLKSLRIECNRLTRPPLPTYPLDVGSDGGLPQG